MKDIFLFSRGKLIPCFSLVRSLARWILVCLVSIRENIHKRQTHTHTHTLERLMSSESISRLINRKQVAHSDTVAQEFKRRSHDANDEHRDFSVVGFIFVVDASGRGYIARHSRPGMAWVENNVEDRIIVSTKWPAMIACALINAPSVQPANCRRAAQSPSLTRAPHNIFVVNVR